MRLPILYKRLGLIIRERRRDRGLTQEKLSRQLGISRASLANIETGRQRVLVHQLYSLAENLSVEVAALLPRPDELNELRPIEDLYFSENVSVEVRQQIVRLLQEDGQSQPTPGGPHVDVQPNSKKDGNPTAEV